MRSVVPHHVIIVAGKYIKCNTTISAKTNIKKWLKVIGIPTIEIQLTRQKYFAPKDLCPAQRMFCFRFETTIWFLPWKGPVCHKTKCNQKAACAVARGHLTPCISLPSRRRSVSFFIFCCHRRREHVFHRKLSRDRRR